jgi:group I intron endonuclease
MNSDDGNTKVFGVYSIIFHTAHGDMVYIGSTCRSFKERFQKHMRLLRRNESHSKKLQAYWNKYKDTVKFSIIEVCDNPDSVVAREQFYIDTIDKDHSLNLGPALPNPMFGKHLTQKMSKIISDANRRRIFTPEMRLRLSEAQTGRRHPEETKEKIGRGNKGKTVSPDTREKLRQANTGKKPTEETRKRMSESHRGRHHSRETLDRMSVIQRRIKQDPLGHDKRSEAVKIGWITRKMNLSLDVQQEEMPNG